MPNFDGRGPMGLGRMGGRGRGPCANPNFMNRPQPNAPEPLPGPTPAPQPQVRPDAAFPPMGGGRGRRHRRGWR